MWENISGTLTGKGIDMSKPQWRRGCFLAVLLFPLVVGCAAKKDLDDPDFTYEEPEPHPYIEPEVIRSHHYLATTPSGNLYKLVPTRIVVDDLSDYEDRGDPRGYLKILATKSKSQGLPFLPYHYYVSPEGMVLEGQNEEYQGYLGGKRDDQSILVGVLGNFEDATKFVPPPQEKALVQQLAALCMNHAISPRAIVPAYEVDPSAGEMGLNLRSWFGATQTLQANVERTLQMGAEIKVDQSPKESARERAGKPLSVDEMF
jgi:hypothetical protein